MAAPRASSFKALRNIQRASSSAPAKRGLHITGAQSSPRIDPASKNTYTRLGLQDLRNECRKRTLSPTGTTHELIDRLAGNDSLQARAFSIAMRRIAIDQTKKPTSSPTETTQRHFNTSRTMKAVNDSSTIDFAYLPKLFDSSLDPKPAAIRVPILPHIESDDAEAILEKYPRLDAAAGGYSGTPGGESQMKAQIVSVDETLADGAHMDGLGSHVSHFSDVQDAHTTELTVEALTELSETVRKSANKLVDMAKAEDSTVRKVINGLLDDIFGPSKRMT